MKLDSKYFDMIRIRPLRPPEAPQPARCQWRGCAARGQYRAPKGRGHEGQFYLFCSEHVRQYNSSYNYFDGMRDAEVEAFQKDAVTGHRPTWKAGANAWSHGTSQGMDGPGTARFSSRRRTAAGAFASWRADTAREAQEPPGRKLKPLEQRSLEAMGLAVTSSRAAIKARFKELVKRHHPDSNGGDRAAEDKLREIIQAYNYLKQAGLV